MHDETTRDETEAQAEYVRSDVQRRVLPPWDWTYATKGVRDVIFIVYETGGGPIICETRHAVDARRVAVLPDLVRAAEALVDVYRNGHREGEYATRCVEAVERALDEATR